MSYGVKYLFLFLPNPFLSFPSFKITREQGVKGAFGTWDRMRWDNTRHNKNLLSHIWRDKLDCDRTEWVKNAVFFLGKIIRAMEQDT